MNNILITGSSGHLGKFIIKLLKKCGFDVVGIDLTHSQTTDEIIDICNYEAIKEISAGCDAIIHTAALHGKHFLMSYSRDQFLNTNILGTHNLLKASRVNGIHKFLYTSTTSIYGTAMTNNQRAVWVDENITPKPRDIYDITKLTSELLCKDYFERENIETTVLRVSRFLPEKENTKVNHRIYRGLDERDAAQAYLLALKKRFQSFEVYNISSDSPFRKEDLINLYKNPTEVISKYYPEAKKIYQKKHWDFPQSIDRVYAIDKAKRELCYAPKYNFETFLK